MFTTFFQVHPATTGLLVDWCLVSVKAGKFVDERMDRLHQIIQLFLYHYFRGILKSPVRVLYLISSYLLTIIFKQFGCFPHVVAR